MTESDLIRAIESSKRTVLKSIQRHLMPEMASIAEDVAQDTYLRYYLAFQGKPPLGAQDLNRWLYVAARNECRRAVRKWNREGRAFSRFKNELLVLRKDESDKDPFEDTNSEQKEWLKEQINLLPSPYRETMILRLAGDKVEAIAKKLNISEGTVKSRISRAKEWLSRFTNTNRRNLEAE